MAMLWFVYIVSVGVKSVYCSISSGSRVLCALKLAHYR